MINHSKDRLDAFMRIGPLLLLIACVYVVIAIGLYIVQRRLIYFPTSDYVSPADLGLEGGGRGSDRDQLYKTPAGLVCACKAGPSHHSLFSWQCGIAGKPCGRLEFFREQGYGVLLTTYRGYSGSSGSPAEFPIKMDALYFYHWLQAQGVFEGRSFYMANLLVQGSPSPQLSITSLGPSFSKRLSVLPLISVRRAIHGYRCAFR